MTAALRITRRAVGEIERAETWWRMNRPAAPDALRSDLHGAFTLLLRQPGIGTPVKSKKLPNVRRLHLGRIRYFVYYQIRQQELVVLSVWHSSRGASPSV